VGISRAAKAPSEFRTLNNNISVKTGLQEENVEQITSLLSTSPTGRTPLCRHINYVIEKIQAQSSELYSTNKKACLIIITDGEATDGDLGATMKPLHDLPVRIIVRLCTNDEKVIDYWNKIDHDHELNLNVIDDWLGEANEIHKVNSWLTYVEPFHRLREFGVSAPLFEKIDVESLRLDEIATFCGYL
jgi:hypothetical protein